MSNRNYLVPIFLIFFAINSLLSQGKYDYVWPYGYGFSSTGQDPRLNFNGGKLDVEISNNLYWLTRQNASICSEEGELLFFTNGCAIIQENGVLMENGDSINFIDSDCQNGATGVQDALILPNNYLKDEYYVLHKFLSLERDENDEYPSKLYYSYVDLTNQGEVVNKNIPLNEERNMLFSYLTGIAHKNQMDWWLINPLVNDSIFSVFKIDSTGIWKQEDQSTGVYFNEDRSSASGTARFSPDGTRFAIYNYYEQLNIYDFDRETGKLSNHQQIWVFPEEQIDTLENRFGSVEWSPNSRFLYVASSEELHQIDTWESDIQSDGIRLIDVYNGTEDPFPTNLFLMALGPDCRIYMTSNSGSYSNHIIHDPDELGTECNFVQNGLKLPENYVGKGLPNFPRYRVDSEEKCDNTITRIIDHQIYVKEEIQVFPNPSRGSIQVDAAADLDGVYDALVYDLEGQLVFESVWRNPSETVLELSGLSSGTYFIELFDQGKSVPRFYLGKVVLID